MYYAVTSNRKPEVKRIVCTVIEIVLLSLSTIVLITAVIFLIYFIFFVTHCRIICTYTTTAEMYVCGKLI